MKNSLSQVKLEFNNVSPSFVARIHEVAKRWADSSGLMITGALAGDLRVTVDNEDRAFRLLKDITVEPHYRTATATARADGKFWMVQGGGPATLRYPEKAAAEKEAERLATVNPGKEFFVMEAVTRVRTPTVERQAL